MCSVEEKKKRMNSKPGGKQIGKEKEIEDPILAKKFHLSKGKRHVC